MKEKDSKLWYNIKSLDKKRRKIKKRRKVKNERNY